MKLKNLSFLLPLAIVACAQLQGLDDYEKVDCVDEGCAPPPGTDGGSNTTDANRPDTTPPATCPPCTDGAVCDSKSLKCVECLPGTKECAAGYFCDPDETAAYKCVLGCGTVQDCIAVLGADGGADAEAGAIDASTGADGGAGTLACCNNRCVDTAADGKNCGACNVICGATSACCASNCQDIVSTPTSCGGCGLSCSTNHIPQISCGARACNGTCETGWADCNTNKLSDGCETSVAADPNKCGGCNTVCSNNNMQTRTCANSQCNGTCMSGFLDCNQNKQLDGCEINIGTDPLNCGDCNKVCSNNNITTPMCGGGLCNGNCNAGFSDCDGSKLVNGCEVRTSGNGADPNNCGGCGAAFVCSSNHVPTRTCNGLCTGTCEAGWGDCNTNKLTDGCETQINGNGASANNCGACGTSCSSNHMQTRTCNGACNGTCATNWSDCNNNKQTDGCETHTTTDSMRCGAGCTACPGAQVCVNGTCVSGPTYRATTSPANLIDACATAGAAHHLADQAYDDANVQVAGSEVLALPFTFKLFGVDYTQYTISSNGYIGFGATPIAAGLYDPGCAPGATTVPVIWAFTDDLITRPSAGAAPPNAVGGICTVTVGTQHVITWKNVRYYTDSGGTADRMTFSIVLNQNTNTIDVLFGTMDNGTAGQPADTSFARVGVESGTNSTNYTCQEADVVTTGTKIRFY